MYNSPLPHDEAAELAEFQRSFALAMQKAAQPVCPPPVVTESAASLAAPVDSGQAGGTHRNAFVWAEIVDFLVDQELAMLGLKRLSPRQFPCLALS